MPVPNKPCKFCGSLIHWPYKCFKNPNNIKAKIRRAPDNKWLRTRQNWFRSHPEDFYTCYICGKSLTKTQTTLDHVKNRSHEELKYEFKNLMPCCYQCNTEKGSSSLGYYILQRRKKELFVSAKAYRLAKEWG